MHLFFAFPFTPLIAWSKGDCAEGGPTLFGRGAGMQIRLLLHIIDICYILDVFNKNLVRLNSFSSDVILGLCARYVALSLSPSTKRKQLKVPHGTSGKRGKSLRRSYRKKRRGKAAGGEGGWDEFYGSPFLRLEEVLGCWENWKEMSPPALAEEKTVSYSFRFRNRVHLSSGRLGFS